MEASAVAALGPCLYFLLYCPFASEVDLSGINERTATTKGYAEGFP
ncbi:MAG: hypothetical protein Q7K57_25185 [Burkholderiaceae bacterium]|nr:hypothetical protein [Burkholderiaceae bacterium]